MAAVERMMTENDVNRGKRKHDITFVRGEDLLHSLIQGGSNMTGTDLCVNKPHCAAAVRP